MKKRIILLVLVMGFLPMFTAIYANNIAIANTEINGINSTSQFAMVEFDVSWDNSWRNDLAPGYGSKNYDAAWVFVKFRVGTADWTSTGASSSGTTITVPSTKLLRVGMPIRVTAGTGAITAGTVVVSIVDATHFTISAAPTTALSGASIECKRIWEHCTINTTGYTQPAGSSIDVANDGKGAYVFRSENSKQATFSVADAQLRWNYGVDGVEECSNVEVKVFAIEMVYVPQGAFYVGDGSTTLTGEFETGTTGQPYKVTNEASLTLGGGGATSLGNNNASSMYAGYLDDFNDATSKTLPAEFPKGYNAFFCMKHEVSQQQYVEFLNTLTRLQQNNRTETNLAHGVTTVTNRYVMYNSATLAWRNGIRCNAAITANDPISFYCDLNGNGTGGEASDGLWIALNYVSYVDYCAYCDWAGLRMWTEMEIEKACRGPLMPVPDEYAWGNLSLVGATGISNSGANNEIASNATANCVYNNHASVQGPIRVGSFADNASNRTDAGATYYGILDVSGNLWEYMIPVGSTNSRAFGGSQGDGKLSNNGYANTTGWPGLTSGEVTGFTGHGIKMGDYEHLYDRLQVSVRYYANVASGVRFYKYGFRAVRTAD